MGLRRLLPRGGVIGERGKEMVMIGFGDDWNWIGFGGQLDVLDVWSKYCRVKPR